ncbi:MAG: efflux RND transporter periplasmic adaptor subunit [Brucellaceae bacterium]|nr:efflux RND transporter periplasmic adaptor subunit [Brucellaceae bacterium]
MSIWKQLLFSIILLAAAAAVWVRFYPGAPQILAGYGLDFLVSESEPQAQGQPPGGRRPGSGGSADVVTQPIINATINDRLTAIGTGRAFNSVLVTPFSAGRLTEVLASSGSRIEAGAVIARLDSEGEQIAVDRARIALEDAEARLERLRALRSSNTVTTVQVNDAELAANNARLALRDAELALSRRSIVAPISGFVGIIQASEGNYVTAQTEIVTIDDRSRILIDFWVPERFAAQVEVGMAVKAVSIARPDQNFDGVISAVDNRIDPDSRTLRLRAVVTNPSDRLRAGMAFEVEMQFAGDSYPAVDPLAIQWGTDGAFVWGVRGGIANRIPVRIVQRNTDSVLVDGAFDSGDSVVTEGIHNVREGSEVFIAGGGTPRKPEQSEAENRRTSSGS